MESKTEPVAQRKVLVVDDEHLVLETLGAMLTTAGYRVTCVPTGAGALAAARLAVYDAALIDVFMPEMDGFETALRLREQSERRGRPIRMWHITGRNSPEVEKRSAQCGMMGLIAKPFSLAQLCARIEAGLSMPAPVIAPDATSTSSPSA
jgi:DNA-binding response OmpR family regulator